MASVNATTKYNQITLTAVGTKGTNEVAKYYYSINNGEFVEDANTHTFTGLNEKTKYTIKVKVEDTQGRMSNVYETSASTDAYVLPSIVNLTTSSTSDSVTINVTGKNGDGIISKYYYSKDGGSNYVESTSNSYTFDNLTSNVTFNISVYVKDSNGRDSSVSNAAETTQKPTIADYVKAQYTTQGANNLYLHDNTLENGAKDNSYRYAGSSDTTNNFVCFSYDSTDGTCPSDNLYRIIGVFDGEVKLIKYDYAKETLLGTDGDYNTTYKITRYGGTNRGQNGKSEIGGYYWNSYSANIWNGSQLNTINLNKNYINNIGSKWSEKISDHTWKVEGNTFAKIAEQTAPTAYQNEINSPATNKTVNAKVGLMYVSDYGYAASSSSWSTILNKYKNVTGNNWMYMGLAEWTLAPRSDFSNVAFSVGIDGSVYGSRNINYSDNVGYYTYAVRPVFYLKSTIGYVSGSGTISSPIFLS